MMAALAGAEVAGGRQRPWAEFRRGPLAIADPLLRHRRSLNLLLAAVVAGLLLAAGVLLVRAEL